MYYLILFLKVNLLVLQQLDPLLIHIILCEFVFD